ncbi:hypothetical protein [Saccharolobus shibatae]|nr:hypothetical protein [Saccharolobus shibatae]
MMRIINYTREIILFAVVGVFITFTLLAFLYNYFFIYSTFLLSALYFSYSMYNRKFMQFLLLVLLSALTKDAFLPLSGYRLKDRFNVVVVSLAVILGIIFLKTDYFSFIALSSALAYFAQGYRLPKFVMYLPPVVLFPFRLILIPLIVLTVVSGYLIGRKWEFIGLLYEISLAFSILHLLNLLNIHVL